MKKIGVVVPTLFTRPDYLQQCLKSIRAAGEAHVILMGPNVEKNAKPYKHLVNQLVEEPKEGTLSSKLSFALSSFPKEIELITWIGDDDLLESGSLTIPQVEFENDDELVLVYGSCDYIDSAGKKIGKNKSGPWALGLAKVGPFLAPQPGSLFDRIAFEAINGLDETLKLAFDFDLFMALSNEGKVKYVKKTLASFRWHEDSLSVAQRTLSVKEASIVRKKHASRALKTVLFFTNPIVELATYVAGSMVNSRLKSKTGK